MERILDEEGNEVESAPHPRQVLFLQLSAAPEQYDILRLKRLTAAGENAFSGLLSRILSDLGHVLIFDASIKKL